MSAVWISSTEAPADTPMQAPETPEHGSFVHPEAAATSGNSHAKRVMAVPVALDFDSQTTTIRARYNHRISTADFTFGLPPSLGQQPVFERARDFADVLYDARFTTVIPFKTYEALEA